MCSVNTITDGIKLKLMSQTRISLVSWEWCQRSALNCRRSVGKCGSGWGSIAKYAVVRSNKVAKSVLQEDDYNNIKRGPRTFDQGIQYVYRKIPFGCATLVKLKWCCIVLEYCIDPEMHIMVIFDISETRMCFAINEAEWQWNVCHHIFVCILIIRA